MVYLYFKSVKESYELEQYKIIGKKPAGFKKEAGEFLDGKFHMTLLSAPMLGLLMFTVSLCLILVMPQLIAASLWIDEFGAEFFVLHPRGVPLYVGG